MTSDEYRNTVGRQRDIMSTGRYSSSSEGTCFTDDAASAESYANFGADDPRITGKPTYLVEVAKTRSMYRDRDGYDKDRSPVPYGNVIRVWEMYADDGAIFARELKLPALVSARKMHDPLLSVDRSGHRNRCSNRPSLHRPCSP